MRRKIEGWKGGEKSLNWSGNARNIYVERYIVNTGFVMLNVPNII